MILACAMGKRCVGTTREKEQNAYLEHSISGEEQSVVVVPRDAIPIPLWVSL